MFNNWKVKIISGGQNDVDRAALDFALNNNIPCGGWCPRGRKAEDGIIPDIYPLNETDSLDYFFRTNQNVKDSNGTLWLYLNNPDKGTVLTMDFCEKHNKPFLYIKLENQQDFDVLYCWLKENKIKHLILLAQEKATSRGCI